MRVKVRQEFLDKLKIGQYPLKGCWFQLGILLNSEDYGFKNGLPSPGSLTDIYPANTFLYKNEKLLRLSFSISNSQDVNNSYNRILIYCLNYLKYQDIFKITREQLFSQLSIIIEYNKDDQFNFGITNIFDIPLPVTDINCSWFPVSESNLPQVSHYQSDYLGVSNVYDENTTDGQLISINSGKARLKEGLSYIKDGDLQGNMTIKSSGIIQL